MDKSILAVLELRIENAKKNARKYAIEGLTATNLGEKCRNEVELAYYLGKAEAYMEIKGLLKGISYGTLELRELIERAADEVLQSYVLDYLNGLVQDSRSFEDGVEALKQKLIRFIDPQSFDIEIVIGRGNQEQPENDFKL